MIIISALCLNIRETGTLGNEYTTIGKNKLQKAFNFFILVEKPTTTTYAIKKKNVMKNPKVIYLYLISYFVVGFSNLAFVVLSGQ
jgi:hypothetical protein